MSFLARRALTGIPLLIGAVTVAFVLTRVAGGDPAYSQAGPYADAQLIGELQARLGTDKPLIAQYLDYLGNTLRGELGTSFITGNSVAHDLVERLPSTVTLVLLALLVATVIGVVVGALAALCAPGRIDRTVRGTTYLGLAIPDFWLGTMALFLFFYLLGWAPAPFGQIGDDVVAPTAHTHAAIVDSVLSLNGPALGSALSHAALPVLTLGLVYSAPLVRLVRAAMLDVLDAEYVRWARACGLSRRRVWGYALRGALPSAVALFGILFSLLLGGAVLIESIFSWGGFAQYGAEAALQSDYPALQGFVVVTGALSLLTFLVVDLVHFRLDPRIRA